MLEGISLFQIAASRLQYLADRQSVIARNIANADTPNYVARDLKPFDGFLAQQTGATAPGGQLALVQTAPGQMSGATSTASGSIPSIPAGDSEKPDGNRVSIEEEMVKSADNANAFALVSAAYAKSISIMKLGIDK